VGPVTSRFVAWDGCVNARDLGGLQLRDGGRTRSGSVFRADNVRHLSTAGWSALVGDGVRTLVDLRFALEREEGPPPHGVEVVEVSLFGAHDPLEAARVDELMRSAVDEVEAVTRLYVDTLETCGVQVAAAVTAVAAAPAGGVAVHCFVGKDRTGIVTAFLLELAGVTREAVIEDYALTEGRVDPLVRSWIAEADTPAERDLRTRASAAPAAAMAATLAELDTRWGGAAAYLADHGVGEDLVAAVRARLREPAASAPAG
jgi:hypothetical protein